MTNQKWCLSCDEPSSFDAFRCSNCGREQFTLKSKDEFLSSDSSSTSPGAEDAPFFEYEEVECDQCGSDLVQNQKWVVAPKIESTPSLKNSRNIKIVVGIIGLVILYVLFTGNSSKQDECFKREMSKFGAIADPKGWAVQSRLYCQSLYP